MYRVFLLVATVQYLQRLFICLKDCSELACLEHSCRLGVDGFRRGGTAWELGTGRKKDRKEPVEPKEEKGSTLG